MLTVVDRPHIEDFTADQWAVVFIALVELREAIKRGPCLHKEHIDIEVSEVQDMIETMTRIRFPHIVDLPEETVNGR